MKYYQAYVLPKGQRIKIAKEFGFGYPNVIAHHVTYKFGVDEDAGPPPSISSAKVVGYANNYESLEALVVEIDGTIYREDGKIYHITWSIDRSKGAKPVHSNDVIAKGFHYIDEPIEIKLEPALIPAR